MKMLQRNQLNAITHLADKIEDPFPHHCAHFCWASSFDSDYSLRARTVHRQFTKNIVRFRLSKLFNEGSFLGLFFRHFKKVLSIWLNEYETILC